MSNQHPSYRQLENTVTSTSLSAPVQVTYVDDTPDVRQWLIDLRRDLLDKMKQLNELIARLPVDIERLK